MRSLKLQYAPRARTDIADIYGYIARRNKRAATAVVRQIRLTSQLLAGYPGLGRETDIPGVRVFPTARYPLPIYHRIRGEELTIIHVRDGQFFSAYSVIDKKWIASGREHANAGNISFPPEPGITREQLTC